MTSNPPSDILRFSVTLFSELNADEFALLLFIENFPGSDQKTIKKNLGIGMRKLAVILRSLQNKEYINYRPGYPETAKSTGVIHADNIGSIPKWVLLARDLEGLSKEKFIYAYLHTFMSANREVAKKRNEIEKVLKIKKSTVKHALQELERLGFLTKTRGKKNLIQFNLFERQRVSLFRSLLGS